MRPPPLLTVPEFTQRSREFLSNVNGFLQSKLVLDDIAEAVLPRKWMERHPSFPEVKKDDNEKSSSSSSSSSMMPMLVQRNTKGERVKNLDELLEGARLVQPKFESIMTKIVRDSGLEPSMTVVGPLDRHATPQKVLTLARLKGIARIVEKVTNELEGDFSRIVDVVRCSVVVVTEEQLESVAQALKKPIVFQLLPVAAEEKREFEVVRLKNRFKTPLFNGYRDALYNIVVEEDCGTDGRRVKHVCEVQLHLADIVAHKEDTHVFYEYFRTYFKGSRAEESRMQALQRLGECKEGSNKNNSVEHLIGSILQGSDVGELENLGYLVEDLMGDVKIALLVRRRILELDPSSLMSQLQYGVALQNAGHLTEAERILRDVHSNVRHGFNEICWNSITSLTMLLQDQGKPDEAEPLMREALDGQRHELVARLLIDARVPG